MFKRIFALAAAVLVCCSSALASDVDSLEYYDFQALDSWPVPFASTPTYALLNILGFPVMYDVDNDLVVKFNGKDVPAASQYAATVAAYFAQAAETRINELDTGGSALLDAFNFWVPRIYESVDEIEGKQTNLYALLQSLSSQLSTDLHSSHGYYDFNGIHYNNASAADTLGIIANDMYYGLTISGSYLGSDGTVQSGGRLALGYITSFGFKGLAQLMSGSDRVTTFSLASIGEDGSVSYSDTEVDNLLDALGLLGTSIQNPLANLEYVLANSEDVAFKAQEQENTEAAKDSFFGDGAGAVKPSNITDAASITSGFSSSFSGAGSVGDIFTVLQDASGWGFFSQEVYDDMNGLSVVALSDDDDILSDFIEVEPGFFALADTSFFDVDAYLGGG